MAVNDDSVDGIANHIVDLEKDFLIRKDHLTGELTKIREEHPGSPGMAAEIEERISTLDKAYGFVIDQARSKLAIARDREKQKAEAEEKVRQQNEADVKNQYLQKWVKAGGAPDKFDEAWNEMYKTILVTQTLKSETQPQSRRLTL